MRLRMRPFVTRGPALRQCGRARWIPHGGRLSEWGLSCKDCLAAATIGIVQNAQPSSSIAENPFHVGSMVIATLGNPRRSEEHTSELQSRRDLVCRLLLEKKKKSK